MIKLSVNTSEFQNSLIHRPHRKKNKKFYYGLIFGFYKTFMFLHGETF